jgi:hypothetical protein
MDCVTGEGSRSRLGVDIHSDPGTGDRYTVANTYNYYWVNPNGNVMGTQTDPAPNGYGRLNREPPP